MNIDLDERACRREQPRAAQRQPVVDALADHQEQVGFPERRVDRLVERRIGVAHGTADDRREQRRAPW